MATHRLTRIVSQLRRETDSNGPTAESDRDLLTRFLQMHDEAAFEKLVRRHDRLVRAAITKVLSDLPDCEDAFQATFLILVRRAKSINWSADLGPWLFGVAHRVAVKAREASSRRTRKETEAGGKVAISQSPPDLSWREACVLLHEELDLLPERYRQPLLLCHLEGKTRDEAAAAIKVSSGTIKGRLERGRILLRDRLARRGVTLSVGLLAAVTKSDVIASSQSAVSAVIQVVRGAVPAHISTLVREATMSMVLSKFSKIIVMAPLMAAIASAMLAAGMARTQEQKESLKSPAPPTPGMAPAKKPAPAEKMPKPKEAQVSGRVLGLDGKSFAGAELFLVRGWDKPKKLGVSGPDGRFSVGIPRREAGVNLLARADGFGTVFVDLGSISQTAEAELRLVKDEAIRGRIVNSQGKPLAGLTVLVESVMVYRNDNLDSFLAEFASGNAGSFYPDGTNFVWGHQLFPHVTTDKEGRFAVAGVGVERFIRLRVRGDGIATTELAVLTRPAFDPKPYNQAMNDNFAKPAEGIAFRRKRPLWGPELTVVAEAEKPMSGVVKDADTGKPRAGVVVSLPQFEESQADVSLSATTNAEGRYVIRGAHKSKKYTVQVENDIATRYMGVRVAADDTVGYTPITIDVPVKKGVMVTGRMIDKGTGKPVAGQVIIDLLKDNPFAKGSPYARSLHDRSQHAETDSDGVFRCLTFPGMVILMGRPGSQWNLHSEHRYKPITADTKYPEFFTKNENGEWYTTFDGRSGLLQGNACKVLKIDPGATTFEQDLVLEPASSLPVKIRDLVGKPIKGTWATGISSGEGYAFPPTQVEGDSCSAYETTGRPRLMIFYEPARKLFGTLAIKGDEKEAVTVTLGPGGSVKGRLVDAGGKPMTGVTVYHALRHVGARELDERVVHGMARVETDAEGNFRIENIVPGIKVGLLFARGEQVLEPVMKSADFTTESGKTTDLGELKLN